MPKRVSKTRPIFVFLGVTESGTDANISVLQENLNKLVSRDNQPIKIKREGDLLILTLINPDFCFYASLVKNDSGDFSDWTDLAKNFKLPWDKKPVSATRLKHTYDFLEGEGKSEYNVYHEIGLAILIELEKFSRLEVFTIPSVEKSGLWYRTFRV